MLTSEHHSFGQSDTAFTNAWLSCSWRCP
jgi:hypothetical protein